MQYQCQEIQVGFIKDTSSCIPTSISKLITSAYFESLPLGVLVPYAVYPITNDFGLARQVARIAPHARCYSDLGKPIRLGWILCRSEQTNETVWTSYIHCWDVL